MKRKMAFLLALVLTVSASLMAYAVEADDVGQGQQETTVSGKTEGTSDSETMSGVPEETVQPPTETPGAGEPGVTQPTETPGTTDPGVTPQPTETPGITDPGVTPPTETPGTTDPGVTPPPTETPGTTDPGVTPQPTETPGITDPGVTPQPTETPGTTDPTGTQIPKESAVAEEPWSVSGEIGQVDVSIGAALILERAVVFEVALTDPAGARRTESITLGSSSTETNSVSFEGLADGNYTLTVSAEGFAAYTQNIQVEGRAYAVNLATGFLGGISYAEGLAHPGVLIIGDVNGDGVADDTDRTALVNAIDSGAASGFCDLNGDGMVNLVDLEYFAKAYNDSRDKQAGVETSVSRAAIKVAPGANTTVNGELENVLGKAGSVTLTPVSGQISDTNPVELHFNFADAGELVKADGIVIETGGDNPVSKAVVRIEYVDENGTPGIWEQPVEDKVHFLLTDSSVSADRDSHGNIRLHLGGQVAVKKVTISIVGMRKNNNLAEISKVEFVNGMETRIPEPDMDKPEGLVAEPGNKTISLSWDSCKNVTGYEVSVRQGDVQETFLVACNTFDVTSLGQKELTNYQEYYVKVQSVNGTWRSGYCEEIVAVPRPVSRPDKPDNVSAVGGYQSITVSWKKMEDTLSYNLFYKESDLTEYQKVEGITENSYVIGGLKDLTSYTVYVTGLNELGESGPSLTAIATTTDLNPVVMPKYKLINVGESGQKGAHIISATGASGTMINSPLDTEKGTAWGTVDNNPESYYSTGTWDIGGFNALGTNGFHYEFDQAYMIDRFAFHDLTSHEGEYTYAKVRYWDENGIAEEISGVSMSKDYDADNRIYYTVRLPRAVKAKKIQFGIARNVANDKGITVSEVYFYYYDSLFDDIMALYEDDLHTVLKPEVKQENIDALRARINTVDEVSGEYHPDREMLERELKTAEDILNDENLGKSVRIHNTITTNDVGRGFGGLNAWQPLGVTAAAQEKIVVYVGHNTLKTGSDTKLQLIATQYNSEAAAMSRTVANLKVGANEITIPKIWTLDYESGGALYVQYTGNNAKDQYAVRVSGGVQVPVLDLYKVTDEAEKTARAEAYVTALEAYVGSIEANHKLYHEDSSNVTVNKYAYDEQTCILGASDILADTMMLSLPAQQILAGCSGAGTSVQARAQQIVKSVDAMEDMMYLFYQHKGLNSGAGEAVNRIPLGHQNIRYQRMFAKAFMYAAGNHIGIGWGSTAGMVSSSGAVFDENGKWVSGSYFGWGIAHEIGHCINQGAYSVAEITNNYFAVLAQAQENNDSVRFKYENVYKKVTSGTKGRASNVFTQLGMYWQLHLAYDNGYNYKTYSDHGDQLKNLFFARVDTYARNVGAAPAPGGVALTLPGDKDQNLMRLACAAAEKNILEFFERWGMTPDEDTRKYAAQFKKETRAVYYINDEARVYRLTHAGSSLKPDESTVAVGDGVAAQLVEPNRIDITLSSQNIPAEDVLGYEIVRCTISGGEVERTPVGFAQVTEGNSTPTFSDIISTMNNRVVYYEVTLIDKYLNRSAVKKLDPIKIEHEGSIDKTFWTVGTKNLTVEGETETGSSNTNIYCNPDEEVVYAKDKLTDNQTDTVYEAVAGGASEIILNFNRSHTVEGFKITGGSGFSEYTIQVCCDGIWKEAPGRKVAGSEDITYFVNADGNYVSTYKAEAVKLILNTEANSKVSIAELDVLGPTGDNVDFHRTEGDNSVVVIGKLSGDFKYGGEAGDVIPEGSIVFAGSYKGNAAYNVVLLYDQDGRNIGKVSGDKVEAEQIILADVPEEGNIRDVRDGVWIYWVEPDTDLSGVTAVRAELYRVNKAETNEGQRLVSDSLLEELPANLPNVTLDDVATPWK